MWWGACLRNPRLAGEEINPRILLQGIGGGLKEITTSVLGRVGYRDFLAELYSHRGWCQETAFYTPWFSADNLGETSAAKMLRLAWKQLRRREDGPARQSLAEAMRIAPAAPRGPAYLGLLLAGDNKDRAQVDQTVNWLMAACALEAANLRRWAWSTRHRSRKSALPSKERGRRAARKFNTIFNGYPLDRDFSPTHRRDMAKKAEVNVK